MVEAPGDSGYAEGVSATRDDNSSSAFNIGDPNELTSKGIILKTSDDEQYLRISKEESKPRLGPTECVTPLAQPLFQSTETTPGGPVSSPAPSMHSPFLESDGTWAEESHESRGLDIAPSVHSPPLDSDGTWAEESHESRGLDIAPSVHSPPLESDGTWAEEMGDENGGANVASAELLISESEGSWAEETH